MPRQPRLDAPGTLHHVMGRGIDGIKIFNPDVALKEARMNETHYRLDLCKKGGRP